MVAPRSLEMHLWIDLALVVLAPLVQKLDGAIQRINHHPLDKYHLSNRAFLSRNYRLIVAPRKFDVLKANMLVLRTSNFQGATIRPIVSRHKHAIVFIVHH